MKDKILNEYYKIANKELGIKRLCEDCGDLYDLIGKIEERIDRKSGTINVNGNNINIETYKIVLNNKILLEDKYQGIDVFEEPKQFISFIITILTTLLPTGVSKILGVNTSHQILVFILSIPLAYYIFNKVRFIGDTSYINYVSFYKLVLDILNK